MTDAYIGGIWHRMFEQHFPAIEDALTTELRRMQERGETPVMAKSLALEIRRRFAGDPKLLTGWKILSEQKVLDHHFEAGEVGVILNFAFAHLVDWLPREWSMINESSASFLIIGFGKGGHGFRGVFRRDNEVRGIYTFEIGVTEPSSTINVPDFVVLPEVEARWLDADIAGLTRDCLECGRPEGGHYGDDGYDCLLRSSRWLVASGIVVRGADMKRVLGQAWPSSHRDNMVTDVRLNSSKYGKYSTQRNRIYRTFVSGVAARSLADELLMLADDIKPRTLASLVEECRDFVDNAAVPNEKAFQQFVQNHEKSDR
jgi:hypothetical protein